MDPSSLASSAQPAITSLEVLEKVNQFYTSAWNNVVLVGTVALVIVGVAVPLFLQWYQQRVLRIEKAALEAVMRDEIRDGINRAKAELAEAHRAELVSLKNEVTNSITAVDKAVRDALQGARQELAEEVKTIRERLRKESAELRGMIFFVQGNGFLLQGAPRAAIRSLFDSVLTLAQGGDEHNLQTSLEVLTEECLPKVHKRDLEAADLPGDQVSKIEKALETANVNGRYRSALKNLKAALAAAQAREPSPPKGKA